MASAIWMTRSSSAVTAHFFGESRNRACHGHPCSIPAGLSELPRYLLEVESELHAQDDGLTVVLLEAGEGTVVGLERFRSDGRLERRGTGGGGVFGNLFPRGAPPRAAIENR